MPGVSLGPASDARGYSRRASALLEELEAELSTGDELTLELPVSIYGGG